MDDSFDQLSFPHPRHPLVAAQEFAGVHELPAFQRQQQPGRSPGRTKLIFNSQHTRLKVAASVGGLARGVLSRLKPRYSSGLSVAGLLRVRSAYFCRRQCKRDTKPPDRKGMGGLTADKKKAGGVVHRPVLFVGCLWACDQGSSI
jgi:hypothetical protein